METMPWRSVKISISRFKYSFPVIKENHDFNLRTNALFVCTSSPCIQSALFTEREVYGEEAECDTEDMREEKQTQTKDGKTPTKYNQSLV
jgi:hypothetical protein